MPVPTFYISTAAGSVGPRDSSQAKKGISNDALAFYIDVFLLAAIALFLLLRLPRAIARFSRLAEWTRGHVLRTVPVKRRPIAHIGGSALSEKSFDKFGSDDSHTLYSHTVHMERLDKKTMAKSFPPHLAASPSIGRPITSGLRYSIIPGLSIGQTMLLLGYAGVLVFHAVYQANIFTDPIRLGFVAMAQIPFVFAFAQKNSAIGWLLAVGYEKLNFLHRFVGRALILAANVHGLGYTYEWLFEKKFQKEASDPGHLWGFIALACLDILFLFSHSFWRQKAYNVFITSHVLGFGGFLVAVCYHETSVIPYVFAALVLFGGDHLWRLVKTRFCRATIRPLPELSLTRVEIPGLNAGWRAGQHVRLRVVSTGMGIWGWTEAHPFTIASVSEGQEGLILMCKKAGGWTSKLYQMAKEGGNAEGGEVGRNVGVIVEGPYGGPGDAVFASYSAALFVAGGSGVTFALSAIQELIQQDLEAKSRVKSIELIWSVQDPASLTPLLPQLTALIQQSVFTPLRISVYYTRAVTSSSTPRTDLFPPALTLSPGRPKIGSVLDFVITQALAPSAKDSRNLSGVVVGVCGPSGLGEEVSKAVRNVNADRRDAVGGVELHEETFGW